MEDLESYYNTIPNVRTLSPSQLIPYFVYYCSRNDDNIVTVTDIIQCFHKLHLQQYSNISQYLSSKCSRRNAMFLKCKNGYKLNRLLKEKIQEELDEEVALITTKNLIDISIITSVPNTPHYIKLCAEQMCGCYDSKLYTACFGMIRRLIETLIIEQFERYGIENRIKDNNDNFFHLSILIDKYLESDKWNASVNLKKSFKHIKKYGDLSVHNRKFFAKKSDIDNIKDDLRNAVQEILFSIDYANWIK